MDAQNVFNHPVPYLSATSVGLNINSSNAFGFIQDKGNSTIANSEKFRQFKAQLKFLF